MDSIVIILLLCVAVVAIAMALFVLLMNRERIRLIAEKNDLEQRLTAEKSDIANRAAAERAALESRHATERTALEEQLRTKIAEIAALRTRAEQNESEREKREEQFKAQFRNLANDILGEQSRNFRQTNKDEIDKLLKPFRDNISDFRERVERIYSSENEQRGALRNELENLMKLNARITTETANLTRALKGDSKVQGDWGEMILDSILDNSNLIRGIHYDTQLNLKDAEGNNLRPDVVLHLPEGKQIVIDSKVSLTAYADYVAAEEVTERQRHLAAHIASVRQHVKELGSKEYQRLLQSPDFVIMFVPNEPAFLTALQSDNSIWSDAYDRKVIISSPTNLFALLKLVDDLWKRNDQSKNTADIVTYGTKLYEQLVAFVTALEGVGQSLEKARSSYDEAYKRLCTGNDNIIRSGERLRKLGLPTKKQQTRRAITASGEESTDDSEN